MSQKVRLGNTYYHDEHGIVLAVHHDHANRIWFRKVKARDNGGVVSTTDKVWQEEYSGFLGAVSMQDYPDDWSELRETVLDRDNETCQGCGASRSAATEPNGSVGSEGCGASDLAGESPDSVAKSSEDDSDDVELHVHHIVPLGCGGTNSFRNLITLCEECHGKIHGGPI